ncbi:holin family protein [Neogemmobacter tilapiae]|uniref:Methionine synthase I n=1 Tax=Neogemmobacter tilapiae TaxID=875041 RepID=A0A918TDM5_9RHOB|nr:holin family protein [Gemmobacter tilapiae]GHC44123.1 hypothetical protein GCM10007315_01580 [Gemmobacter tilapiae]
MGLIGRLGNMAALGQAARDVAGVIAGDETKARELDIQAQGAALGQMGAEFGGTGWFDRALNGLNRLPRPLMVFGTLGLFTYAMVDPVGFSFRMEGLNMVPEALWWILGAIVAFYFGARETHYMRGKNPALRPTTPFADNAALEDWRRGGAPHP